MKFIYGMNEIIVAEDEDKTCVKLKREGLSFFYENKDVKISNVKSVYQFLIKQFKHNIENIGIAEDYSSIHIEIDDDFVIEIPLYKINEEMKTEDVLMKRIKRLEKQVDNLTKENRYFIETINNFAKIINGDHNSLLKYLNIKKCNNENCNNYREAFDEDRMFNREMLCCNNCRNNKYY